MAKKKVKAKPKTGGKLYEFISGGASYGLGYVPGEIAELTDESIPSPHTLESLIEANVIAEVEPDEDE